MALIVHRRARRLVIVACSVVLGGTLATGVASADSSVGSQSGVHYAVNKPLCATPKNAHALRCFALERVRVSKGTPGAYAYTQPATLPWGPNGGYSPELLASAYGYNPDASTSGQLVAIIDWYNDPNARSDLNHFDANYGLPKETSTSFRQVNQSGKLSPLPADDPSTAGEIALDIESVRAVCHTCRILLVEANAGNIGDTATAVNTAVRMGATEISNSYGAPVAPTTAAILKAYNHPGVVITASTGDQGWYGWTYANSNTNPDAQAADSAFFPSTAPTVVGVSGTRLLVDENTGAHAEEYVWNDMGVADDEWITNGLNNGATGGGCSATYAAPVWQSGAANYPSLGCAGERSAADISAIGDPGSGFDVYLTYGGSGWTTIGGTSLSSPVVAAMYALSGGANGAAYPASTLYANAALHPSSVYDVVNPGPAYDEFGDFVRAGGNGWCAGASIADCSSETDSELGVQNPNVYDSNDYFDCSFPRTGMPSGSALDPECNAATGFDGPTGLGTPAGLGVFARTAPGVTITRPSSLRLHYAATFKARVSEVVSGAHPTSYTWKWGDGHSTTVSSSSASISASHTYGKPCRCTVTLSVLDTVPQQVIKTAKVVVGEHAAVHYKGPKTVRVHHAASFSAAGSTTPNTGAHITRYSWTFGDRKTARGAAVKHTYAHTGRFTVTLTVTDSTGVKTTSKHVVKVTR
jgi:hypothetical protein